MADIFISYAREDRGIVERLAAQLEAAGLTCWWDKQLGAGDKYLERTGAELDAAKAVLVVWSKHSTTSDWVADEAGVGRETGKLAPISIDGSLPPLGFRQFQVEDFSPWLKGDNTPFDELVASLRRLAPGAPVQMGNAETAKLGTNPRLSRRQMIGVAAALGALVLALASWGLSTMFARAAALAPSIAVLPFDNISGDPSKDYLARGVAMEIIDTLARLKGMEVISRNSSFSFPANADPVEVGTRLKVAHVLSGTVREQEGRLTITSELLNAKTGNTIWADTYEADTPESRIDGMQTFIAEKIAGAMSVAFGVDARRRINGGGTNSLDAYDLYLRGLDAWWTVGNTPASIDYYTKATAIDPDYAEAWAGLAIAIASTGFGYADPAEARARQNDAFALAERGVKLAPDLNVTQTNFGAVATTQFKWIEGDEAFQKALAISRAELTLVNWWFLLQRTGRLSQSAGVMKEIEHVDPVRGISGLVVHGYAAQGRFEDLKAALTQRGWFSSTENFPMINVLQYHINIRGERADIRTALEKLARNPDRASAELATRVLAKFDNPEKARAALRAAYADPKLAHPSRWEMMPYLAAWLGDTDLVLQAWHDELPLNVLRTLYIWDPAFAETRKQPGFKTLVRDLGLVDYWRAKGWADKCRPVGTDDFECA